MTTRRPDDPLDVLVTLSFPSEFVQRVAAVDPRVRVHHHPAAKEDELPDGLLARAEVMYTSEVLPAPSTAPALRWAQLDTSGVDHVVGTGLWDCDVVLTTLGGVSPAPLAEWVLMMVLSHAHGLRRTEQLQAESRWPSREERWTTLMPVDLRRRTLGILGYGRIGREVARLARAFGMDVVALRRSTGPVEGRYGEAGPVEGVTELSPDQLDELLRRSDYLVLTVPLTAETRDLVGARELDLLPLGAVVINGSRGGVVDEPALLAALESGQVAWVASDVFVDEPLPPDSPWWSHPRSVVTPHVAGFAPDYVEAVGALFCENLRRYLAGQPLVNVAERERGY